MLRCPVCPFPAVCYLSDRICFQQNQHCSFPDCRVSEDDPGASNITEENVGARQEFSLDVDAAQILLLLSTAAVRFTIQPRDTLQCRMLTMALSLHGQVYPPSVERLTSAGGSAGGSPAAAAKGEALCSTQKWLLAACLPVAPHTCLADLSGALVADALPWLRSSDNLLQI